MAKKLIKKEGSKSALHSYSDFLGCLFIQENGKLYLLFEHWKYLNSKDAKRKRVSGPLPDKKFLINKNQYYYIYE